MHQLITLPQAIALIEGWQAAPHNRPTRNCNPGNIEYATWLADAPFYAVMETVQPGVRARFARFPNAAAGWAALEALLEGPGYRDLSVRDGINRYAPPDENNTQGYVDFVCEKVGCSPDDRIADVMKRGTLSA